MATTKNDITGDVIQSKGTTDKYRDGWERIFGKKAREKALDDLAEQAQLLGMYDNSNFATDEEKEKVDVTSDSKYSIRVP